MLRDIAPHDGTIPGTALITDAAALIERQAWEIERLTQVLESSTAWLERWAPHVEGCKPIRQCTCGLHAIRAEARAALVATEDASGSQNQT